MSNSGRVHLKIENYSVYNNILNDILFIEVLLISRLMEGGFFCLIFTCKF